MYNNTILIGVMISMLFTEFTGYSAGLIIPGYLVLTLHSPGRIAVTYLVAAAAVFVCRALSQRLILYGRRKFAVLMFLTFFINFLLNLAGVLPCSVIGIIMPGVIARELDRQGFAAALAAQAAVTLLTALVLVFFTGSVPGL